MDFAAAARAAAASMLPWLRRLVSMGTDTPKLSTLSLSRSGSSAPPAAVSTLPGCVFTAPVNGKVGMFDLARGEVVGAVDVGGYLPDLVVDRAAGTVFVADARGGRVVVLLGNHDDRAQFRAAFRRIRAILDTPETRPSTGGGILGTVFGMVGTGLAVIALGSAAYLFAQLRDAHQLEARHPALHEADRHGDDRGRGRCGRCRRPGCSCTPCPPATRPASQSGLPTQSNTSRRRRARRRSLVGRGG